jgi:hypothetical protein
MSYHIENKSLIDVSRASGNGSTAFSYTPNNPVSPQALNHCYLPDGLFHPDGDEYAVSVLKRDNLDSLQKTGGYTNTASMIIYDILYTDYLLDPNMKFIWDNFSKNLLWYADCCVGTLSTWKSNGLRDGKYSYFQLNHTELINAIGWFKQSALKFNDVRKNGTVDNVYGYYKFHTTENNQWIPAQYFKWFDTILDLDITEQNYIEIINDMSYDKIIALLLIHEFFESSSDKDYREDLVFHWVELGAGNSNNTNIEESALAIFKINRPQYIDQKHDLHINSFFTCYDAEYSKKNAPPSELSLKVASKHVKNYGAPFDGNKCPPVNLVIKNKFIDEIIKIFEDKITVYNALDKIVNFDKKLWGQFIYQEVTKVTEVIPFDGALGRPKKIQWDFLDMTRVLSEDSQNKSFAMEEINNIFGEGGLFDKSDIRVFRREYRNAKTSWDSTHDYIYFYDSEDTVAGPVTLNVDVKEEILKEVRMAAGLHNNPEELLNSIKLLFTAPEYKVEQFVMSLSGKEVPSKQLEPWPMFNARVSSMEDVVLGATCRIKDPLNPKFPIVFRYMHPAIYRNKGLVHPWPGFGYREDWIRDQGRKSTKNPTGDYIFSYFGPQAQNIIDSILLGNPIEIAHDKGSGWQEHKVSDLKGSNFETQFNAFHELTLSPGYRNKGFNVTKLNSDGSSKAVRRYLHEGIPLNQEGVSEDDKKTPYEFTQENISKSGGYKQLAGYTNSDWPLLGYSTTLGSWNKKTDQLYFSLIVNIKGKRPGYNALNTFVHEFGGHKRIKNLTGKGWGHGNDNLLTINETISLAKSLKDNYKKFEAQEKTWILENLNKLSAYAFDLGTPEGSKNSTRLRHAYAHFLEDEFMARVMTMITMNYCVTFAKDIYPELNSELGIVFSPQTILDIDIAVQDAIKHKRLKQVAGHAADSVLYYHKDPYKTDFYNDFKFKGNGFELPNNLVGLLPIEAELVSNIEDAECANMIYYYIAYIGIGDSDPYKFNVVKGILGNEFLTGATIGLKGSNSITKFVSTILDATHQVLQVGQTWDPVGEWKDFKEQVIDGVWRGETPDWLLNRYFRVSLELYDADRETDWGWAGWDKHGNFKIYKQKSL